MNERLEAQARNEALIREVNERIAAIQSNWDAEGLLEFFCECGRRGGCDVVVHATLEEYERVRAQDDRFLLSPGHETGRIERVVGETERYVIVDKISDAEPIVHRALPR